ncbi:MAG: metallophosphoesterase [Oscillochloridaceae bacterium umkhey_bin13]
MTTLPSTNPARGRRFDPSPDKIRYSRRWLGAAAVGGTIAALAVAQRGLPALATLGALGTVGASYALLHEPRMPRFEQIRVTVPNLPPELDGLRIGQLSDLHLGMRYTLANTRWAVAQLAQARPDLLVLTGDVVSYEEAIPTIRDVLAGLPEAPLGRFAVPGNHDYWEGIPEIRHELDLLGFDLLINEHRSLGLGAARLVIAGADDLWEGTLDLEATFAGAPSGAFRLLLAHCPDVANLAPAYGVHLQLSGHTHGGHLSLPGLGACCLPRHGWDYPAGHVQVGPTQVYVSRGLGGLPLRFGCPPEVTLLTLCRQ